MFKEDSFNGSERNKTGVLFKEVVGGWMNQMEFMIIENRSDGVYLTFDMMSSGFACGGTTTEKIGRSLDDFSCVEDFFVAFKEKMPVFYQYHNDTLRQKNKYEKLQEIFGSDK